jgi:steroid delta-isomerase-like uncharacterized protein
MSTVDNQSVVRRFYEEVLNKGDLKIAEDILSPDFHDHGAPAPGIEGFKQLFSIIAGIYPDIHVKIEDMIAEEDKVAVRLSVRGTQKGAFRGFPATNKQAQWTGMDFIRLANGRMVERWGERDFLGMLQQLGYALPPE